MKVIFVRHASAEPKGDKPDRERRLTDTGRDEARTTAQALRRLGAEPGLILTSPLPRAVETAEILAEVHAGAVVQESELLTPPADAEGFRSRVAQLLAEGVEQIAAVGHAPTLDHCAGMLVAARPKIGLSLSKAGAALVEVPDEWPDAAPELTWVMRREALAMIAGR